MTDTLEIPVEGLEAKLKTDKVAIIFFVGFSVIVAVVTIMFCQDASIFADDVQWARYVIPVIVLVFPALSLKLLRDMQEEHALMLKTGNVNLIMGPQNMEGPIAILEGPTKDNLRKQGRPKFSIPWTSVEKFIIEPARGRGQNSHSPPYFKITIKGKQSDYNDGYFIRRQFFKNHEAQIVDFAQKKLGTDKIILNDKLR